MYEKWTAEMNRCEYQVFLRDIYGRSKKDGFGIARRLLKGKNIPKSFQKEHLVEWTMEILLDDYIDPEKKFDISNLYADPEKTSTVFVWISKKNSQYRNLKIDYLKQFGFKCEGA